MATSTTTTVEGIDAADPPEGLDERDHRALTEYLTVLEHEGRAARAAGMYLVISGSHGDEYLVDVREERCTCPDHEYRGKRCKHIRRVAFEIGLEAVPAELTDRLPRDFAAHVDAEPTIAATDGGVRMIDAGDEGEILEDDDGRPEACACWPNGRIPCFTCYRAGFETTNPETGELE